MTKFVRMTGSNVTEVNFSQWGIFTPRDDGSFAIPEAAVPEALKAGLVRAELSQSKRLALLLDQIRELEPSPHRDAILNAARDSAVAAWQARHPDSPAA